MRVSTTPGTLAVTVTGQMERGTFVRADAGGRPAPEAVVPTTTEDLRRAYYTGPGASWEWWVVEIDLDPAQLIVENDSDGNLYRVPYSVTGAGQVEFGEAVVIQVDYVDAPAQAAAPERAGARRVAAAQAVGNRVPLMVWASRASSRPAAAATPPEEEHPTVTPEQLALLGLPADATPEQINARLTELAESEGGDTPPADTPPAETPPATPPVETPPATPPVETPPATGVTVPDGTVLVDAEQWAEVQRQAQEGAQVAATQRTRDRDDFLRTAVEAGKFAPARLAHWQQAWDKDPEGTRQTIESLADGLIPVAMRGHNQVTETPGGDGASYPSHWLPELAHQRKSIFTSDNRGEA